MKTKNIDFVSPNMAKIAAKKAGINSFLKAQTSEHIEFDAIRNSLPAAERAEWTDAMIQQVLQDLGYSSIS